MMAEPVPSRRFSAGVVVVHVTGETVQYLLLRAYKNWDFPKGLVEPGEQPLDAAVREVKESVAIPLIVFQIVAMLDWVTLGHVPGTAFRVTLAHLGYLGAVVAGDSVARVSVTFGWQRVFFWLAAVSALAAVGAGCLYILSSRAAKERVHLP